MTSLNAQPEGLEIPAELLNLPKDKRDDVRDAIWGLILKGVVEPSELADLITDYAEVELSDEQCRAISDHLVAARRAQQASFGSAPSTKLDQAFVSLREHGIVAEQDFTCCGTCGVAEIGDKRGEPLDEWRGYVFFHTQDTDSLVDSGSTYLNYGVFLQAYMTQEQYNELTPDQVQEQYERLTLELMNQEVIPILQEHGIGVVWDGSLGTRILLTDVEWYCPI